ncbi:DUF5667 domain-containing protein [Streptomyces sp. WMMC897]|uniref:DUF5667 domain-containing protein n=1 Tax=Streptomyces sp. WMMC897 TaxID=3014782 RepID=UPI0022B6A7D7|nr:DUF5667 domain-containing protein [Streptomyces sp. WMMC897]MCZ7417434.1 DUF5667 domain-containing protein [Streptomyces sp. WMMC897]
MIGSVSTNRRANAFAQALDERAGSTADDAEAAPRGVAATPNSGQPASDAPAASPAAARGGPAEEAEQRAMLALAEGLSSLPAPELDPEVKAVQRAQLVAAMENQFAGGGAHVPEQRGRSGKGAHRAPALSRFKPRSRLGKGLAAGGLTVGVAAGAFTGVAGASTNALPGDTLYGLKRGMEDLKLDMAGNDSDRGVLYLDHASTRLNEARRLMERGRAGALDHESLGEVRNALDSMRSNASEGHRLLSGVYERDGDLAPMRSLSAFAQSHRDTWVQLRDRLPVQLQGVGDEVNSVFDAINEDVEPLRDELLPPAGDGANRDSAPGSEEGTVENYRTEPSDPSSGAGTPGQGGESSPDSGREPSPTESGEGGETPEDGLIGGDPGLLDPLPTDPEDPLTGGVDPLPGPDVTIPPLLPGGLPGLGVDVEDMP